MAPSSDNEVESDRSSTRNATENTPLLSNEAIGPSGEPAIDNAAAVICGNSSETNVSPDDRPLDYLQVFLLCFVRLVEPVSFFSIFPYINQMISENGDLPEESVGKYSGLIESLFSLTQMLTMVFWGRASDRFGRKPVLVVSLAGITIFCAAFGFAKTLAQMIVFRCLAGVFAGTLVTIRTMIQEYSTVKTQARAFSWFAFSGNLGIFLGPLMGGALANPAKQYGGWFARQAFFNQHPYALATLATGALALIATLVTVFGIKETLNMNSREGQRATNDETNGSGEGPMSNGNPSKSDQLSILELLRAPGVPMVLINTAAVMICAFGYTAMAPIYMFTSQENGGFGLTELQISILMATMGAAQSVWLLLIFPPLAKKLGSRGVMRLCGLFYPVFIIQSPLLSLVLRSGGHDAEVAFWVLAPAFLSIGVGVSMAYTAMVLCLNDVAPSQKVIGALNSISLAMVSGVRAFTPVLVTNIYSISLEKHLLGGQLVWVILAATAVMFGILTIFLPDKTDDRIKKPAENGD